MSKKQKRGVLIPNNLYSTPITSFSIGVIALWFIIVIASLAMGYVGIMTKPCNKELLGKCVNSTSCEEDPEMCQQFSCDRCFTLTKRKHSIHINCVKHYDCDNTEIKVLVILITMLCLIFLIGSHIEISTYQTLVKYK